MAVVAAGLAAAAADAAPFLHVDLLGRIQGSGQPFSSSVDVSLGSVVETWSHDPDVFGSSAKYKPALDQVAAKWTKTKTYYDALTSSRDLDTALALVQPDVTPTAIDAAVVQVRGKDGAMLHAIAVVLELP